MFAPVGCRLRGAERRGLTGRRSTSSPVTAATTSIRLGSAGPRLRFNCRCSRPPNTVSSFGANGTLPRRPRSRPSASVAAGGGAPPAPRPGGGPLGLVVSTFFLASCLRRWSARGVAPCLPARMASAGNLISGFCGVGSLAAAGATGCDTVGSGVSTNTRARGPGRRLGTVAGRFPRGVLAGRFVSAARHQGRLAAHARGSDVVFAAKSGVRRLSNRCGRARTRSNRRWRSGGSNRSGHASRRLFSRSLGRATGQIGLHLVDFFIRQARQRRALAAHARFGEDVDQRFAVQLQFFG